MQPQHVIVYSHGFGVRKDDRGLFADIAAALPHVEHIMFDYGSWDDSRKELTVASLNKQADLLAETIFLAAKKYPLATLDLICHSQGCVVAALLDPAGIRKAILTGPPARLSVDDMMGLFANRRGSSVDRQGVSHLTRSDFSTTNVPSDYWESINNINPVSLYNKFSDTTAMTLVNATEDEIIGSRDFSQLSAGINVVEIATGHNFEGDARTKLIDAIKVELGYA